MSEKVNFVSPSIWKKGDTVLRLSRLNSVQLTELDRARFPKGFERELTDRKVRCSNPTSSSRLPLSRLRQPGSIQALVLPSCGIFAGPHVFEKHTHLQIDLVFTRDSTESLVYDTLQLKVLHISRFMIQKLLTRLLKTLRQPKTSFAPLGAYQEERWLKGYSAGLLIGRSVVRIQPLHLDFSCPGLQQPGSTPSLVLPSGGMAARHRKGATAERRSTITKINDPQIVNCCLPRDLE
ncbi:hypothetical protein T265_03483 [Opisthorchis viverrini]|uniref:Uncharacterized protein n=1 Tax=Opisthorchis viverrini TaxID=6198 RepID=A0A074ZRF3_OPIVI|nr:hypothetical protein T265_03483 [Opisthorchis viverrini]KER30003.1 hypothetical protein T265_03483 [Opisthorchis viverrini]